MPNTRLENYRRRHIEAFESYSRWSFSTFSESKEYKQKTKDIQTQVEAAGSIQDIYKIIRDEFQGLGKSESSTKFRKMLNKLDKENQSYRHAAALNMKTYDRRPSEEMEPSKHLHNLSMETYDSRPLKTSERARNIPQSNSTQQFWNLKQEIKDLLDLYISNTLCLPIPCKFSIFGHHHDSRARDVKYAINMANNFGEIKGILDSQIKVLKGEEYDVHPRVPANLGNRWTSLDRCKNRPAPDDLEKSGFYKQIEAAYKLLPQENHIEEDSQHDMTVRNS